MGEPRDARHRELLRSALNDAGEVPGRGAEWLRQHHARSRLSRITPKLPALDAYQLNIPAPTPPAGSFDAAAAARGDDIFNGAGKCGSCQREPCSRAGVEPARGRRDRIDNFQADVAASQVQNEPAEGSLRAPEGRVLP